MVTQPSRPLAIVLTIASFALIGFFTLRAEETSTVLPTYCVICGTLGGVDFVLNTFLFVPLGLSACWLSGKWSPAIVIGVATTIFVETVQWRFIPGRHASLGDLIANTLGTILGAWLATDGVRWLNATGDTARRLAAVFGLMVSGIIVGSALVLLPTEPRWAQYVQWTPLRPNTDPFPGELLSAELNGRPLYATRMFPSQWTLDSATRGMTVKARMTAPEHPARRQAIVVRIANEVEEGFMLAQHGELVVFRAHLNAARLRLRPLLVGLDDGLPVATSGSDSTAVIMLEAGSNPRAMTVRSKQPAGQRGVTLRRTVGLAWSLISPREVSLSPSWWPANALWLGILVFPVSFFSMRSGHTTRGDTRQSLPRWWPPGLVVVSLVTGPPAVGLSPLGLGEWLGVAAGVAAGWSLERWTHPAEIANLSDGATQQSTRS
jgi:hypothetical protein